MRTAHARRLAEHLSLLIVFTLGCEGGTDPTRSISLSLSSATSSIVQGASGTITVTIGRVNYTGDVALSLEGAPAEITWTFDPATLPNGTSTSTLTFHVGTTALTESAALRVRATGTGLETQTQPLALTVLAAPDYTITPSPPSITVPQGGSGTSMLTITRTGGFAGAVSFAASGLPSGVTASFSPTSAGATSSTLTVTAASDASPEGRIFNIVTSAAGIADKTKAMLLTVAVTGSYSLAASPSTMSLDGGASGATTVSITRTGGFSGAVSLAASGLPSGVTASFDPASATGNSSTLTLSASSNAAIGTTNVTITGATPGLENQTTTVSLTVAAAPNTTSMSLDYCADPNTPSWFAYKNEGGSWTRVTPTPAGTFNFRVTPRFSTVAVYEDLGAPAIFTEILHTTTADLQEIDGRPCVETWGSTALSGNVVQLGSEFDAEISMAFQSVFVDGNSGGSFHIEYLPTRPLDLVGTRRSRATGTPDRAIIRRGVSYPDGGTIPSLDFGSTEAFTMTTANVSTSGVGSNNSSLWSIFVTQGGTAHFSDVRQSSGSQTTYAAMPSTALLEGDMQFLSLYATNYANGDSHGVQTLFRTAGDKSLALGPTLGTPTYSTLATSPYLRMRAEFASQPEYGGFATLFLYKDARWFLVNVSSGFIGGTPTRWDLSIPDFTAVDGWQSAWGLAPPLEDVHKFVAAGSRFWFFPNDLARLEGTTIRWAQKFDPVENPYYARGQTMRSFRAPLAPHGLWGGRRFGR